MYRNITKLAEMTEDSIEKVSKKLVEDKKNMHILYLGNFNILQMIVLLKSNN